MASPITSIAATTVSNDATSIHAAPHRKNAAQRNRSDSPYQQRTTQRDNPTQVLIKQAVDYLIEQLEAGLADRDANRLGFDDASEFAANRLLGFGGNQLETIEQRQTGLDAANDNVDGVRKG